MKKVLFIILLSPLILSIEDWIYIVGVYGNKGVVAKLRLKIINGSGNVYVDTFPLTKVDTQASARIARDVSCEILNVNCSKYDFLFKIEGESEIVGGPSAGAAMTVLSMALLSGVPIRKDVVITGTISPDWSVGPVGGIRQKYLAVKNISKKFLVPYGEKIYVENMKGARIIEIKDIIEAYYHFTGRRIVFEKGRIEMDKLRKILKKSAEKICRKAEFYEYLGKYRSDLLEEAYRFMDEEKYYSAASYCVRVIRDAYKRYLIMSEEISEEIEKINKSIEDLKNRVINYSDNVELVFIFYDRLYSAEKLLKEGVLERDIDLVATAKAKLEAAKSWLELIEPGNKTFDMSVYRNSAKEMLERARINILYASTFVEGPLIAESERKIGEAQEAFERGDYIETIFYSKEAEALSELSLEFLSDKEKLYQKYKELSDKKLEIEIGRGYYPILALSYKEYGEVLKDKDIDMAIYFLKLSMKFSSLPSEIKEFRVNRSIRIVERSAVEENPWMLVLPITMGLVLLIFMMVK